MPRFTNKLSGSVVNVSEKTAAQLGPDWAPTDAPAKADTKPTRRTSK